MNRARVVLMVAAFVVGYLANEPSATALLGIVVVASLAFGLLRFASERPVAPEEAPREVDHMAYELSRARRFERVLGLVAVRPADGVMQPAMRQSAMEAVGTRRIDRSWLEDGTLFMLLPETDPEGAAVVIRRIEAAFSPGFIRAASAVFPIHAVTSEGLIQVALDRLNDTEQVRPIRAADSVS